MVKQSRCVLLWTIQQCLGFPTPRFECVAMLSCCGARFVQLVLPLTALGALSPCLGQSSAPQQRPRQDGEGRPRLGLVSLEEYALGMGSALIVTGNHSTICSQTHLPMA